MTDSQKLDFIINEMSEIKRSMVTNVDLQSVKMELYKEIIIVEKEVEKLNSNQSKIDTLYINPYRAVEQKIKSN